MTNKYGKITKNILLGLALGGAIVIAATSPYFLLNLAKVLTKKNKKVFQKNYNDKAIAKTISRLNKNKLVILSRKEGVIKIELSEKGKRKVKEIQFDAMQINKPKHWDKKWRVVVFDIPDRHKKYSRDALRSKLKNMHFYPLQKSVWVHPYPCEQEIQLLCEVFEIWPYINILVAEKIFNDEELKKHFGFS